RVVLTFATCGRCANCTIGHPAYCERRLDFVHGRDGSGRPSVLSDENGAVGGGFFGQSSFATYAIARQRSAIAVADDIDPALAAPLACSVQTGVGTVINVLDAQSDDVVVVFGVGSVGLAAVMGARIAGCRRIIAVDPVERRRTLATELGAS